MSKQKTAVEQFADSVLSYKNPTNLNGTDYIMISINKVEYLKEKLKEMEKEQIVKAANFDSKSISENGYRKGEQYYNETYGGNNYNETFKQCKCGMPQVGGWQCARTDCNQNELYGGNK